MLRRNKKSGFSFVELVVVIAILAVLLAVLSPMLISSVEHSRMQKDDSVMDEVVNAVHLAITDDKVFDEVYGYCISNNYMTYTDSSGVYGNRTMDEEFWAPDGSGPAVTITFNPDENGNYDIGKGIVNDMTYGNGSVAEKRTAEGDLKQCYFEEMGNQLLYSAVKQSIGNTISEKSATYKNSSYTVFIRYYLVDGTRKADVYGAFNGTNLSEECPAAIGSNTSSYDEEDQPISTTPTGGRQESNYTNSDLTGGGSVGGSASGRPSYKPCSHPDVTKVDDINHRCNIEDCQKLIPHEINPDTKKCVCGYHEHNFDNNHTCTICGYQGPGIYELSGKLIYSWDEAVKLGYIEENGNTFVKFNNDRYKFTCRKLVVREGITEISSRCLAHNTFTEIVLPDGLITIGSEAFSLYGDQPRYFRTINIPNTVETIGARAFQWGAMSTIFIPDSVKTIGAECFESCALESVKLSNQLTALPNKAFYSCRKLTSIGPVGSGAAVELPDTITSIGNEVFRDIPALERIEIPDTVTSIGMNSFYGSGSNNTTLIIGKGIQAISNSMFAGIRLKELNIPSHISEIGPSGFKSVLVTEINIPHTIKTIGDSAFADNLAQKLTYPNTIESIGSSVFANSYNLTDIQIEEGTQILGKSMFERCGSLRTLKIPTSLTKIPESFLYSNQQFKTLYYDGTREQFDKIPKGAYWQNYKDWSQLGVFPVIGFEIICADSNVITFDLDGGVLSRNMSTYYSSKDNTLPTPTKDGYVFTGWTGSNGDIPQKNVIIPVGTTGEKHYTAHWE